MKETLLTKRCSSRKKQGNVYICTHTQIPCKEVKREDCILLEEYRIVIVESDAKRRE